MVPRCMVWDTGRIDERAGLILWLGLRRALASKKQLFERMGNGIRSFQRFDIY